MGGYKTCILEIKGEYVYSKLKYEVKCKFYILLLNLPIVSIVLLRAVGFYQYFYYCYMHMFCSSQFLKN